LTCISDCLNPSNCFGSIRDASPARLIVSFSPVTDGDEPDDPRAAVLFSDYFR
jgi:hypothetical protein